MGCGVSNSGVQNSLDVILKMGSTETLIFRFGFDFYPSKRCIMKSKRLKMWIITNETFRLKLVDIAAAAAAVLRKVAALGPSLAS